MAVTTTNLGVITAYGDAVAAGYTGTKAEWQALMASYATVAEEANDAKDDAVAAKNTAVAKATEATTAAATANTAKDTATSKATEATTAANTATTKANEASASAQSIAQSAAQIQENTDDIDEIESELAVTSPYNITWSQGGINSSGTAVSRTNRIRTDYITIENDSIFVEIPSGFKYAIHAYNASKTRIGYIPSGSDIMTDRKATYKVSDSYNNAVYFRMWVAYADDSDILPTKGADVTVAPFESVIASLKSRVLKSVRILGVGNSYTRDSIRWLCKILKESGYENVVVGHGYLGASTLAEQYASLDPSDSNHSAFEYWKYNDTKNATKTSGKTLDEIFTDEPWDIVIFQQQSDESGQYASYVSSSFDINNFITYISGKVSNADLKFGLMMPWSHADGYTSTKFAEYYNSDPRAMLDAIKTVIPQVAYHMSQCDYVVNAGEAIDLGRQNSYLNALGDQMLRTDKNHLYYGIPSYMVGLVYALTLCDVNLNNVMWYPTATDEGQTGITTSGYLAYLAKQCAFTAVNGYALEEDISQLKSDLETNFHINGNVKPNLVVGSFIDATNNRIYSSDNFSMTEPISVKKGQKVTLTARGYNAVVGMIATCNDDNTERVTVVASVDSNEHDYIYNVTEDGYIVCSFNHGYDHKIAISIDYYSGLENVKSSNDTIENFLDCIYAGTEQIELSVYANGFVDATNNKYNSGGDFNTTNSVHLFKGQTINLTAIGYRNVVGMINLYDSVNDKYQTVVRSADNVTEYSYTATSECDVRMCYLISAGASANVVTNDTDSVRLNNIESDIDELKNADLANVEYPKMFTNIICIGDSLTRGESGGSQSVQLSTNYPFYFEKLTGATCYNGGLSGRTTKQWWDEWGSTITGFANYDCAVIYLGTNGGLTDTVETDCNASDYTQNADTNTGCYGKIIGKIKADAPNCKIFCVAGPSEYLNRDSTMNPVVRKLADFYEVGLIDLSGCLMDDNGTTSSVERYLYRPIDGIHYNKLGYFTLANMIYDYMKNYMENHLSKYVS